MIRPLLALAAAALAVPAFALAQALQAPTGFDELGFKATTSKVVLKGSLSSPEEDCVKGRKVKLIHKKSGNTKTLGSDQSDSDGDFKIKLTDPPLQGKYYGKVKQKNITSGGEKVVCLERETGSISISTS